MPRDLNTSSSPLSAESPAAQVVPSLGKKTSTGLGLIAALRRDIDPEPAISTLIGSFDGVDEVPVVVFDTVQADSSREGDEVDRSSLDFVQSSFVSTGVLDFDEETPAWVEFGTEPPPSAKGGSMAVTIRARDIEKGYGPARSRSPIVRGVSLTVHAGETVFLTGPSGSGKTTLLSVLGCILTPDRGTVEILGKEIGGLRREQVAAFRRENLGFIFQTFNLFPTLSALDNVKIALSMRDVPSREALDRAAELLVQVGLGHRLHIKPTRLSTGECQRVAIARALTGDPSVLLADEPTASLDAENGQAVMEILAGLSRDRGLTMLIVTHDNRIDSFADRILGLEDGCLVGPGSGRSSRLFSRSGVQKEYTT